MPVLFVEWLADWLLVFFFDSVCIINCLIDSLCPFRLFQLFLEFLDSLTARLFEQLIDVCLFSIRTYIDTNKQTNNRQTDRQTDRQIDRQTDSTSSWQSACSPCTASDTTRAVISFCLAPALAFSFSSLESKPSMSAPCCVALHTEKTHKWIANKSVVLGEWPGSNPGSARMITSALTQLPQVRSFEKITYHLARCTISMGTRGLIEQGFH